MRAPYLSRVTPQFRSRRASRQARRECAASSSLAGKTATSSRAAPRRTVRGRAADLSSGQRVEYAAAPCGGRQTDGNAASFRWVTLSSPPSFRSSKVRVSSSPPPRSAGATSRHHHSVRGKATSSAPPLRSRRAANHQRAPCHGQASTTAGGKQHHGQHRRHQASTASRPKASSFTAAGSVQRHF